MSKKIHELPGSTTTGEETNFSDLAANTGALFFIGNPITGKLYKITRDEFLSLSARNLQQVTDVGFYTSNPLWSSSSIAVQNAPIIASLTSDAYTGALTLTNINSFSADLAATNVTQTYRVEFPNYIGSTPINLPLSVNGNYADATGNIITLYRELISIVPDGTSTLYNVSISGGFGFAASVILLNAASAGSMVAPRYYLASFGTSTGDFQVIFETPPSATDTLYYTLIAVR